MDPNHARYQLRYTRIRTDGGRRDGCSPTHLLHYIFFWPFCQVEYWNLFWNTLLYQTV